MKLHEINLNEGVTFAGLDMKPIFKFDKWYSAKDLWHPSFPDRFAECLSEYFDDEEGNFETIGWHVANNAHSFYGSAMTQFILYAKKHSLPETDDEDEIDKYVEEALLKMHEDFDHPAYDAAEKEFEKGKALKKMVKDTGDPELIKKLADRTSKNNVYIGPVCCIITHQLFLSTT